MSATLLELIVSLFAIFVAMKIGASVTPRIYRYFFPVKRNVKNLPERKDGND